MTLPCDVYTVDEIHKLKILLELSLVDELIFPHWEFPILTGASVSEAQELLSKWPNVTLEDEVTMLTLRGVLGNLIGYPHKKDEFLISKTGMDYKDYRKLRKRLDNLGHRNQT